MRLWQTLKSGWMAFARGLAKIQTAILLTLIYIIAVGPLAIIARLARRDLLGLRRSQGDTYGMPVERITLTLEGARKQF